MRYLGALSGGTTLRLAGVARSQSAGQHAPPTQPAAGGRATSPRGGPAPRVRQVGLEGAREVAHQAPKPAVTPPPPRRSAQSCGCRGWPCRRWPARCRLRRSWRASKSATRTGRFARPRRAAHRETSGWRHPPHSRIGSGRRQQQPHIDPAVRRAGDGRQDCFTGHKREVRSGWPRPAAGGSSGTGDGGEENASMA